MLEERILAFPQRPPTAAKESRRGTRMPPRPHSPHTVAHTAKRGRNCWGLNDRWKNSFFFVNGISKSSRPQSLWLGSAWFLSLPFSPRAAKSGCGRQPAKSAWLPAASQTLCLPHPRVGKIVSSPLSVSSRTAGRCGVVSPAYFSSPDSLSISMANKGVNCLISL